MHYYIVTSSSSIANILSTSCQGRNSGGRRYKVIARNHTPFWSNVQCWGGMYLAMIEKRLQRRDKDVRVESDLLNDLGFNLYVALLRR